MVKIRLRRMGAKKQPSYRVVVTDSRSPRDGRFLEIIGRYDPRTDPPTVVIREDRALYWMSVGAQPTDAVATFFRKLNLNAKVKKVHAGEGIDTLTEGQVRVSGPAEAPPKSEIAKRTRSVPEKGPSRGKGKAAPDADGAEADEPAAAEARPKGKAKPAEAAPAETTPAEAAPVAAAESAPVATAEAAPVVAAESAPVAPAETTPAAAAPADAAEPAPAATADESPTPVTPESAPAAEAVETPAEPAEPATPTAKAVAEPESDPKKAKAAPQAAEAAVAEPKAAATKAASAAAGAEAAAPKATAEKAPAKAPEKGATSAEGDLASLGLAGRTAAALEAAGVHDVKALRALSKKGDDALLAVPGIGAKAVDDIHAKLGG